MHCLPTTTDRRRACDDMLGFRQEETCKDSVAEKNRLIFTQVRTMVVPMREPIRMKVVEVSLHRQGREEPVERVVRAMAALMRESMRMKAVEPVERVVGAMAALMRESMRTKAVEPVERVVRTMATLV